MNRSDSAPATAAQRSKPGLARRLIPVVVLAAGLAAFFILDLGRYVSFDALREHRDALQAFVSDNGVLAIVVFVALYAVVVAFSLPGGAVMTITSGFLFGTVAGAFAAVVGATIGATALFLIAKTALGDLLRARAGPFLARMEKGFRENALSYLLFLRLIPVFPFFLVNLVPAFLGVSTLTYIVGTFFGIIPGTIIFASVGNGIGAVLDAGQNPDLGVIFKLEVLGPLVALGLISLLPIAYKKYRSRRGGRSGTPGTPS